MKPLVGIGADVDLYQPLLVRRSDALIERVKEYVMGKHLLHPRWLDVGSGESYMREITAREFHLEPHVSGVDVDLRPYRYTDGWFRLITSFDVFEHLFNPLFHLRELRRILADDGNLIMTTPNDQALIFKVEHLLNRKYRPHFHQYSERDLRDITELAGFRIVYLKKYFESKHGTIARISRNSFFVHAVKK